MGTPFVTIENSHKFLDSPHYRVRKIAKRCQQEYWQLKSIPGYPQSPEEENNWQEIKWVRFHQQLPGVSRPVYENARRAWNSRKCGWKFIILECDHPGLQEIRGKLALELYARLSEDNEVHRKLCELIALISNNFYYSRSIIPVYLQELSRITLGLPPAQATTPPAQDVIEIFTVFEQIQY